MVIADECWSGIGTGEMSRGVRRAEGRPGRMSAREQVVVGLYERLERGRAGLMATLVVPCRAKRSSELIGTNRESTSVVQSLVRGGRAGWWGWSGGLGLDEC